MQREVLRLSQEFITMATLDLPTKSRDEYRQLAHIGRGAYGDVFLCEHVETGERVCMKEMDLTFHSPDERARCLNEVALLKQLPAHPNVVGFREAFWARSLEANAQVLVLILEHADGGDLEQRLRCVTGSVVEEGEEARRVFKQVVEGVNHLHSHRVVHRDLKCSNVFLFRSGRVVLGDFGTSKFLPLDPGSEKRDDEQDMTSTVVGSPLYMSPELLEGDSHGFATDIWSLGCVLYELLSGGKPAFAAPSYPAVVFRITQGEYDPLNTAVVSPDARKLLDRMLQRDPHSRPSIGEVLQSPWFQTQEANGVKNEESQVPVAMDCRDMTADEQELDLKQGMQDVRTLLVQPAAASLPPPPPPPADNINKLVEILASHHPFVAPPPPAPVHQVIHPNRHRKEIARVTSPLIRLDIQPPPISMLPTRKHLPTTAASIPFKHFHQQHSIPVRVLSGLEVRGVHISGTARQIPATKSIPKP